MKFDLNNPDFIVCEACGEDYIGIVEVNTERSTDDRYLKVELIFSGECDHRFSHSFSIHEGTSFIESTAL